MDKKEYNRKYRELNKDKINKRKRDLYEKTKQKQKEYNNLHKEEIKEQTKKYREEKKENIKKKQKEYRKNNKDKIRIIKIKSNEKNKDKIKNYHKNYYETHKEERKERDKLYRELHKEEISKRRSERKDKDRLYYQQNKEKILKQKKELRDENKYITAWRNVLRHCLERFGLKKFDKTIDLLGYSALDLKLNIESKFIDGMTWDNYGEWHIDHIKPISSFDKDTLPSIVNALSNLQPLWAIDNLKKGKKYLE